MINTVFSLLKKDILLELRQKHTFYGILLYIASTVFVLWLSVSDLDANVWNGLFWVIQLFVCVNAVAKSFLQETRGRMLYFYSIVNPRDFVLAKLVFNSVLMLLMSFLSLFLFSLFLGNPIKKVPQFIGLVMLGGWSLSLVFTFLSAIAAKAQQNAAIMAILGFPIIIPQLMLLMQLANTVFSDKTGIAASTLLLIVMLDVLVIMLAVILFPFLWKD